MREEDRAILSYQRDRFVDTNDLTLPFIDDVSGTIRGFRVFTACRTVNGKIFRLEDHLNRLYSSASGIFMMPPLPREDLRNLLDEVVAKNSEFLSDSELLVEIIFSGGLSGDTMQQSGAGAHLYVAVQPLVVPEASLYASGVVLATYPHQRMCPSIKLLNYVGAIMAHQTAVPTHSAYEVLFIDPTDQQTILEGSTFTVFFVDAQGSVATPPLDGRILDSVTRRVVLEILRLDSGINVIETPVGLDELPAKQECFIASTTRSVLPVTRIDAHTIGDGRPGPVTQKVRQMFRDYLESY